MPSIIECIPNFSEGRDRQVIDQIADAALAVPGIMLLHRTSDSDHNRTVLTFAGTPEAVIEGVYRAVETASELIDLTKQTGQHPRMGAADVVPLVPIQGITLEECAILAHQLGRRIGDKLQLPVYMYEAAATRPERRNLADVRRGGYEFLVEHIASDPARYPDYGPASIGPAGAVIIGAREILIAYNVFLDTTDVEIAGRIAAKIRESSGGLPYVKALGLFVDGRAQVSMNLTNYRMTPVHIVVERIRELAAEEGVGVERSELIGLMPQDALYAAASAYLQLPSLSPNDILEHVLSQVNTTSDR